MAAEGEIEDVSSLRMASTYPRDLLRRFAGDESAKEASSGGGGGGGGLGEVELSLGLSLGGCFGEPKRERTPVEMATGMVRSSSISFPPMAAAGAAAAVARTCSLPVESEEERRRRKEMQSLKRMEAKRKRSEKRAKEKRGEEERPAAAVAAVAAVALMGPAKEEIGGKVKAKAASQGSIGSQGSSSSGVSDFDSRPGQGLDVSGLSNSTEARSPSTISSAPDNSGNNKASPGRSANLSKEEEEPSKRRRIHTVRPNGVKETGKNMLEEMPCVSTKGDGPNGKRIEGFLYKYQKGEEVRIMCVCHGNFLTPAEFVKHAGGGDVDHPLRHIVVNPNPSALS